MIQMSSDVLRCPVLEQNCAWLLSDTDCHKLLIIKSLNWSLPMPHPTDYFKDRTSADTVSNLERGTLIRRRVP